jgi:Pyruvate/2-oxoacid:ferredoxin oxidoreductase delta subunit
MKRPVHGKATTKKRRKLPVWPWRRLALVLVLGATFALPVVARYGHYLSTRQLDKVMKRWDGSVQGETLQFTDAALRVGIPDGEGGVPTRRPRKALLERTQEFQGSPWSARIGGLSLTDPMAGVESAAASKTLPTVLLMGLIAPVLITLLLGRVFCAWVCPMTLFFDLAAKLRAVLPKWLEITPLNVKIWDGSKYVLLGVGAALALVSGISMLSYIYPPAIIGRESHFFIAALFDRAEDGRVGLALVGLTGGSLLLVALFVIEILVAPRVWCTSLCPGGALYSLLGRFRLLRIRRTVEACIDCQICDRECPRGMLPMTDLTASECDNCGVCIDVCPTRALGYRMAFTSSPLNASRDGSDTGKPAPGSPTKGRPLPVAGSLLLAAALVFGAAPVAHAHHIMGIPHYSYDENYPQAPVLKLVETVGSLELQLTSFPGNPQPGDRTEIHVYVVTSTSRRLYTQPLTATIYRVGLLGREEVFRKKTTLLENVFKFYPTFVDEGNYEVTLSFADETGTSTLTFPMVVGEPGSPWATLGTYLGGLLFFLLVVRSIRIKRVRRQARELAQSST